MRLTVSRWLAIVSLVIALAMTAAARTRPHYGGTLRVESQADALKSPDAPARRLLFDTLTQTDASGELCRAWPCAGRRKAATIAGSSTCAMECVFRWCATDRGSGSGVAVGSLHELPLAGAGGGRLRRHHQRIANAGITRGTGAWHLCHTPAGRCRKSQRHRAVPLSANSNGILFLRPTRTTGAAGRCRCREVYGNRSCASSGSTSPPEG